MTLPGVPRGGRETRERRLDKEWRLEDTNDGWEAARVYAHPHEHITCTSHAPERRTHNPKTKAKSQMWGSLALRQLSVAVEEIR